MTLGYGQETRKPFQVIVPEAPHRPRCDGKIDTAEWEGAARLVIDAAADGAASRPATSSKSARAEARLAHDTTSLYLAIQVEDGDVQLGTREVPGRTDGLALLLRRADPAQPPGAFVHSAGSTLCIWFTPTTHGIRQVVYEVEGEGLAPVTSPWSGMLVQGTATQNVGYSFEVELPFHGLFGSKFLDLDANHSGPSSAGKIAKEQPQLEFDLVLCDRSKSGTETTVSRWSRAATQRPWLPDARLEFAGRAPLAEVERQSDGMLERLLGGLPHVLVPVAMLAIAALGLLVWTRTLQRWPLLRPLAHLVGILCLVLAFLLPPFETWRRDRAFERRTVEIARLLRDELPHMEQGTLASLKGAQLDRPVLDLLSGKPVAPRQGYTFRSLFGLAQAGFGTAVKRYPGFNCSVLPYWIPLPVGQVERFHFEEPLRGHSLYMVFSRPIALSARRGRDEPSPRVRAGLRELLDSDEADQRELTLEGPFDSGAVFNREGCEMTVVRVPLRSPVAEVSATALEGEGLQLVAITLAAEPGDAGRPLPLGLASEGGVATELRGAEPDEAGVELYAGQRSTVSIALEHQRRFDRMWLFAAATSRPEASALPVGTKVGELLVRFKGGKPELQVPLAYQVSLFHEIVSLNVREPGGGAEPAFRWTGSRGEARASYSLSVDLPPDVVVESVEFASIGPHRIAFRALVFGTERLVPPQEQADSPLYVTSERREVAMKPRVLEQLSDAWFAIYRGGRLVRSTLPDDLAQQCASEKRAAPLLGEQPDFSPSIREIAGGRLYEATVAWSGPGLAGAVLGVFVPDAGRDSAQRTLNLLRVLLCLLSVPALLAWAAQLLSSFGTLRLRLLCVLGVATLAPLAVLTIVLVRVLENEHSRTQSDGLKRAVAEASARLGVIHSQMSSTAASWLETVGRLASAAQPGAPIALEALERLRPMLTAILQSELSVAWGDGRIVLEIGAGSATPFVITVPKDEEFADHGAQGPRGMATYEMSEGRLWLRVRAESELKGLGRSVLSAVRPCNDALIASLDPARALVLSDADGYAFAFASGQDPILAAGEDVLRDATSMRERRATFAEAVERAQPVQRRHDSLASGIAGAYRTVADLASGPKALLGVLEPVRQATIDTPFGRLPVRSSFAAVAGLVLLIGVFLSLVVTSRITRPIEDLERGALALRHGDTEIRLRDPGTGQIRSLQDSFQLMAQELRTRTQDLSHLTRCIQELGAATSAIEVHSQILSFCARHTPADRVRSLMLEGEHGAACIDGDPALGVPQGSWWLDLATSAEGPFCLLTDRGGADAGLTLVLAGFPHALVVPWSFGGRSIGAVFLLFGTRPGSEVVLEPVIAVATHAAARLENLRLLASSVEDIDTGALRREPFGRRVVAEVAIHVGQGKPCSLIALAELSGRNEARTGDSPARDTVAAAIANILRRDLPAGAILGRSGPREFRILLPGFPKEKAQAFAARFAQAAAAHSSSPDATEGRWRSVVASCPEEASSAEFLQDLVTRRLLEGDTGHLEPAVSMFGGPRRGDLETRGIGTSTPAMQQLIATIEKVAPTDLTILLEGETGTGKELIANLVHDWSKRATGPLVRVHCAAIPANLLLSELFGYEKGAFTGALARKAGKFEQASSGSIFLDEIGEISAEVQISLLRVLQERVVDRIGGTEPVPVDVRVIAATNRNLREMVARGTFREDLYYRLQGMIVTVPPLRERKAEIPGLADRFLREAVASEQTKARGFSPEAYDALFARDWPGNVRELRNLILRAAVLASGPSITPSDLSGIGEVMLQPMAVAPAPTKDGSAAPAALAKEPGVAQPSAVGAAEAEAEAVVLVPQGEASPQPGSNTADRTHPRLRALLELLRRNQSISVQDCVHQLGVSSRTGLRDLSSLIECGIVERTGARRGARYRLKSEPGLAVGDSK